eukprot:2186659-Ditylum_brightwellii.AAC.1
MPYCTEPELLDISTLLPLGCYHTHVNRAEPYNCHIGIQYEITLHNLSMFIHVLLYILLFAQWSPGQDPNLYLCLTGKQRGVVQPLYHTRLDI